MRSIDLLIEMAKIELESIYLRLRRVGLERLAAKLPIDLLNDVRLAATEEMERRGYHFLRPRSRKAA